MDTGRTTTSRLSIGRSALIGTLAVATSIVGAVVPSSVALADGAQPLSTGLNADGQLGNGTTSNRLTPGAVDLPANMVAIASGREQAYALDDTGRIWAWGNNASGAVGDGTRIDRPTPVRLSLTNVAQVEAGHYHGIALRTNGTVWTWGRGGLGQLGLGNTATRTSPVQVPGLTDIVAVAAGRDMSYAVRENGTMLAWGNNGYGELGDGTTTRRTSPVAVSGLTNAVGVSGGRNHVLVVRSNGSLWAWGRNSRGQLGVGDTSHRSTPVQVLSGSVEHADAGAEHSVAVMTNGTVRTWGRGQRGQLGLGTTASRSTPTTVPGLSGIVEVGDARDMSFAMNADGDIWGWGYNDAGQLGDGTTTRRLSPVRISTLTGIVAAQGGRAMTIFLPGESEQPDPDVNPPSAPGRPTATSTIAGRADVSWPASTDDRASSLTYSVYRDGGGSPIGTVVGGTTGTISYADTGLPAESVHTYRVRASDGVNQSGLSATSDPVTIAGGGEPPPPTGVDCTVSWSGSTATLNWNPTGRTDVVRRNGRWLATPQRGTDTYVDQNAPSGATYLIRTNGGNVDNPCTGSAPPPPPPDDGCSVDRNGATVTLTWNPLGGTDVVRRNGRWLATVPRDIGIYVDTNAPAGATYIVRAWPSTGRVDIACTE